MKVNFIFTFLVSIQFYIVIKFKIFYNGKDFLEEKMDSKKILNSIKLPKLSNTLNEIIELEKQNPISFLNEMKNIIERDPLLSAHVMKVANSPLFGFSQKIRTISHSIGLLGIRKIRNISLAFSILDFFKKAIYKPEFGKTFNSILKKSLLVSAVSTILGKKVSYINPDELYISGLLADIGQLVLFLYSPGKYHKIYSFVDRKLISEERRTFKTDHVKLGTDFCDQWNFPHFIKVGIKNHFELGSDDEYSKISFISNQISELLLAEEVDKNTLFKEVENHTKKILHLSLSEVEEAVKALPCVVETYIKDFPELQKDLNNIIKKGPALILSLIKKEMDMVILTQELSDSQKKMAKEKIFLSHLLNLSYFFSSLISPQKIISSLFEYFENFINEFSIEFIYKAPENDNFLFITDKDESKSIPIYINDFISLVKARISNEVTQMEGDEIERLKKDHCKCSMVFPIAYHHDFFGYLLLNIDKDSPFSFDLEMSYIQILSNIIANSFRNYLSFHSLKKETSKKELVTKELFKFERELENSKKIQLKLQKREIMTEMLPVILHKLKNKLTPILGYSQILLTKVEDDAVKERIRKIEKNANELTEQLNLLKDYFKSEKQVKEKENLNNIINHLNPYFSEIEANEKIIINLDLNYDIPDDTLIPGQLEYLVTNIVDNAIHAIKEKTDCKGIITIKTQLNQDSYSLIIRDNGIGIKEETIPLVWAPFYSGFHSKAGLGLAICEKIISNHEGFRSVESIEGEYTEFRITFQKKSVELEEITDDAKAGEKAVRGNILIVDDEAYLADLMKEILLIGGDFNITTINNVEEAIKLINDSFDLIISYIRIPEIDGMKIYDFLKSKNMGSKLIMVTADPFSDDVSAFLKENKIDYLKKPFEMMEFKKRVLKKLS